MAGDAFELAETSAWGDVAVEDALFGCMSFSVESVSAPAMTEVNTAAERTMLSGLFIFLLSLYEFASRSAADRIVAIFFLSLTSGLLVRTECGVYLFEKI
jgi:hypothetical protein